MHEAAIADSLCRMINDRMAGRGGRITKVTVVAGNLCGIVPEQLERWFAEFSRGGPAGSAKIALVESRAKIICRSCGLTTEHDSGGPVPKACNDCGGKLVLKGGRELYLDSLEIEE